MKTCETCAFWNDRRPRVESGECYRYPPALVAENGFTNHTTTRAHFPWTWPYQWCGEHAPREGGERE